MVKFNGGGWIRTTYLRIMSPRVPLQRDLAPKSAHEQERAPGSVITGQFPDKVSSTRETFAGVLVVAALVGCGASHRLDVPCDFEDRGVCFIADPASRPLSGPLRPELFKAALDKSAAAWGQPVERLAGWQVIVTSAAFECEGEDSFGCTYQGSHVIRIIDLGVCAEGFLPHEFGHAATGSEDHRSPIFALVDWPKTSFLTPEIPDCEAGLSYRPRGGP